MRELAKQHDEPTNAMRAKPGYISDQESAEKFDYKMQKLLWAFACANNCVNPLLYKMMGQKSK